METQQQTSDIEELKREVTESRSLSIKTNNALLNLGADIKAIAKKQAGYERRMFLNSSVTYVIIAVLCLVALQVVSSSQIREANMHIEVLQNRVAELEGQLRQETQRDALSVEQQHNVEAMFQLVQAGHSNQIVETYPKIRDLKLSPIEAAYFKQAYEEHLAKISENSFEKGKVAARKGQHDRAIDFYLRALQLDLAPDEYAQIELELANSLRALNRGDEALSYAQKAAQRAIDVKMRTDAWWLVAEIARERNRIDVQRNALNNLLGVAPDSDKAPRARELLQGLGH